MTLKEKRDLIILNKKNLKEFNSNNNEKYELIIKITNLLKEVYNNTRLLKLSVILWCYQAKEVAL